ncbi:uncharacterized protein LOC133496170 isoform X2 [Syngnathoides biaculeatus]|uniref:uncharacterized protein LOC133496170 isoform X2 n=3 Tax=Syngnathoides biaculeatus TaxID=300417 RepID=UPI002ADE4D5E|nr:uncharacterized protein LOC133496170 isoform X2 [Syngnathoides biaculeatus]
MTVRVQASIFLTIPSMSSANIMVQVDSGLTSSVSLSIATDCHRTSLHIQRLEVEGFPFLSPSLIRGVGENLPLFRMQDNKSSNKPRGVKAAHLLQDERTVIQKKTFSRWMNVFLQRSDHLVKVNDLFMEIQDGWILMAALEELSGCKLVYRLRSSTHRMLKLSNISKVLAFLNERQVKLFGIDAAGIVDGIPSVVLNLIWSIILHFQVKEVTAEFQKDLSPSRSSASVSSYPSSADFSTWLDDGDNYCSSTLPNKCRNALKDPKHNRNAIKSLLLRVQRCTSKFGIEVHDFGKSWRSGLAFLALIKSVNPTLVDLKESLSMEPRECIEQAFTIAHRYFDMPTLLDAQDVARNSPDEQSIITYVSMFMGRCSQIEKVQTSLVEDNIPHIPNFGSIAPPTFGGTVDPAARNLLESLKRSSEQDLWKRWARKSSGSFRENSSNRKAFDNSTVSSCHGCNIAKHQSQEASQINGKSAGSTLQPQHPLEAGGVSQEIRSWMEKGSKDRGCSKTPTHEGNFSMSSEEGIYSLSALDSEEEDDCSLITDLSKDVFLPYAQLRKLVPNVVEEEEEEEEDVILKAEKSKHLKDSDFLVSSAHDVKRERGRAVTRQNNVQANYSEEKEAEPQIGNPKLKNDTGVGLKGSHFSKEGFFLQFSAASCDVSPLEVELLLLLWLLLYCCLIVSQMSL